MTDPAMFLQEYEIDFAAKEGQLVYQLHREATLEQSFCYPQTLDKILGFGSPSAQTARKSMDCCRSFGRRLRLP
jgi:hypothetical protein